MCGHVTSASACYRTCADMSPVQVHVNSLLHPYGDACKCVLRPAFCQRAGRSRLIQSRSNLMAQTCFPHHNLTESRNLIRPGKMCLRFNLILHHLILHHLLLHFCLSIFGCCAFQKLQEMSWQSWDKSNWSHYGRKSSWESWEDSQGWSQSQSPRTPPRKTRAEDYGSPQGSASRFSVDVPDDFCQTKDYLDTREVYGLKFPKKIQPSSWAVKHQLAGREVTSIQLHEICWQGWNNYSLRALAQGRYVSVNFARSIKEATFISFMLQKIRESKLDLDQIADAFCTQNGPTVDVSDAHLVDYCSTFQQQDLADAQDRIKALEQELAAAKRGSNNSEPASGSKRPHDGAEPSSTSDPSAKRVRLPVKTPASQVAPPSDSRTLFQKAMDPSFVPQKVLGSNCPVTTYFFSSHHKMDFWLETFKCKTRRVAASMQECVQHHPKSF